MLTSQRVESVPEASASESTRLQRDNACLSGLLIFHATAPMLSSTVLDLSKPIQLTMMVGLSLMASVMVHLYSKALGASDGAMTANRSTWTLITAYAAAMFLYLLMVLSAKQLFI